MSKENPKGTLKELLLSAITTDFYVRVAPSEDRINYFVELYKAGVAVPPIWVSKDGTLVAGRHRKAAQERLARKKAHALVLAETNRAKLIAIAFAENYGDEGHPMQPTQTDIEHTIELLFNEGVPRAQVARMLPLAPRVFKYYAEAVQGRMIKKKMRSAVNAVAEGTCTVKQSAEKYGVDLDKLKGEIRGEKQESKLSIISDLEARLTQRAKSFSGTLGQVKRRVLEALTDSEITLPEAKKILRHAKQVVKGVDASVKDFDARLVKLAESLKK
jgi:hypothetical protein